MLSKINVWLLLVTAALLITTSNARRVRIQAVRDDQIQYYNPEEDQSIVLVSSADEYNGLYGQPASSRSSQDNYIPQQRTAQPEIKTRAKEANKAPPVQTIRNYNKVNDDGSFTFGYEAADGSFKEETRGTDCVVRGKYGYVDPDGNKREFTYVSGNPCDPNAVQSEESDERPSEESNEPDNGPANYPTRPIRPLRPVINHAPKPTVTVFQNTYDQIDDEEQPEPEQVLRQQPIQPTRQRLLPARPTYVPEERQPIQHQHIQPQHIQPQPIHHQRQRIIPHTTPTPVTYDQPRALTITPRPATPAPTRQPPPTTYRPQLVQVAVTPRPSLLYTKQYTTPARTTYPSSTAAPLRDNFLDFAAEFQKFQHDNQLVSSTPAPSQRTAKPSAPVQSGHGQSSPVYSSELVYDPTSGQYNTQLYQSLPQTEGEFTLNHRIQPYVHQPQSQLVNFRQLQQQSPLYRPIRPNQQLYQQQQSDLQFQNSQQLYAQQQKARTQTQQAPSEPQQFYYIQPAVHGQQQGISSGQIEAFLRGHNIQF